MVVLQRRRILRMLCISLFIYFPPFVCILSNFIWASPDMYGLNKFEELKKFVFENVNDILKIFVSTDRKSVV